MYSGTSLYKSPIGLSKIDLNGEMTRHITGTEGSILCIVENNLGLSKGVVLEK